MKNKSLFAIILLCSAFGYLAKGSGQNIPVPIEIVDLGALITEDLPYRVWGGYMEQYGFEESNSFRVINQKIESPAGTVSVNNSYLTLFNHGGPHVDVPSHVGGERTVDSYSAEDFIGPLKVIDVSHLPYGRTVTLSEIEKHNVQPGDIVLIYTGYVLPGRDELPHRIALSREAAEYLATLPVKSFGTDSLNVDSDDNPTEISTDFPLEKIAPIHHQFLSRGIPVFEQLFNLDRLLGKRNMYFVGQPLNIENGDGMIVRPVVFVYD